MSSLLIRGLRQSRLRGGGDWRELMTSAVRGKWPAPKASARTLEAESGLGIRGEPYYFYVLRAEESFGFIVFVLREVEEAVWPLDAKGATPFDSGGLWSGKIRTDPGLDRAGRRKFFRGSDVHLVDWRAKFEHYIGTRYGTVSDYVKGSAPRLGNKPMGSGTPIIEGQSNTAQAWTWEVRVPHDEAARRLELQAAYMTEADRRRYLDWLWHGSLTERESSDIHRWVEDYVIVPTQDESVAQAVEDRLMLEVADV